MIVILNIAYHLGIFLKHFLHWIFPPVAVKVYNQLGHLGMAYSNYWTTESSTNHNMCMCVFLHKTIHVRKGQASGW